ncbi:MAG: DNA polymerase I [SAR324 cluster bacterium]|nr:DNA polymerase I [SAR324 cluster bacterium]MBL7035580.1 DNA polymerase I [SAR324 cluster bacterium]
MSKLFAVDSMAVLYRGYFAMIRTPLINSKGLNTSGIRAFLMQLVKIIEEEKPDYLAVTSDSTEPTFRHKRFPDYKATREKMPEDLVEQLPYLPRLVEALNLPYLILPGFEADDIVGTLMRLCGEAEIEGVMVTSDKDYMQLVTEKIVMLNHRNERLGIPGVFEKFGCAPEQVIEMLGLMGDSSDNIPGVRGVGEKTAMKLIAEYGNIETVYENLENVSGKSLKEKLAAGHDSALLSRELATIDCRVPLAFTLEDVHLGETDLYDNPQLFALLEELEFNTLLNRLHRKKAAGNLKRHEETQDKSNVVKDKEEEYQSAAETEKVSSVLELECSIIETPQQFQKYLQNIPQGEPLALALKTSGQHQLDLQLLGLAICAEPENSIFLDFSQPDSQSTELFAEVKKMLESAANPKIFHGLKKTIQLFSKLGFEMQGTVSDVMLAAHMTDPLLRRYELDYLLGRKLNLQRKTKDTEQSLPAESQLSMFEEPDQDDHPQFCEDAAIILRLQLLLAAQLKQTGMEGAFQNIEIPLATTLAKLELAGVRLDVAGLGKIALEFEGRLQELRQKIVEQAGEEFNPNSVIELQNIIYEKLRLHEKFKVKPKKIKLGNRMSTDEETLEKLAEDELPRTILSYRTLNKLKNTYVDQLPTYVHADSGCIHSTFQQTGTATGRLSSENPNLQNIPVRSSEGRRIRRAFIASGSEKILISADYSQIELRVVAHYSKDPTFMDAYRRNLDIHALTAAAIFKVAEAEVTREMRSRAKEVNFGLIYRMGPERLSIVTKTTKAEAKEFIERYFQKYSTIHALQERFLAEARKEGFSETIFGRRRYLPEINTRGLLKRMAEGAAVNTPIQGSAAEIIKLAMIAVDRRLSEKKMQSKMILTVHDELVFDALKEEEDELCEMLKETMENVVALEVPLLIEIGKGNNWLDAH